jgi:hypothetical protein
MAAKPECISPQIDLQWARCARSLGRSAAFGAISFKKFTNRQGVPDFDAIIIEAGNQDRRRQQQNLGPGVDIIRRDHDFSEGNARLLGHQPAAQRP